MLALTEGLEENDRESSDENVDVGTRRVVELLTHSGAKCFCEATRLKNDRLIVDDKDCLIIVEYSIDDGGQSLRAYETREEKFNFILYILDI